MKFDNFLLFKVGEYTFDFSKPKVKINGVSADKFTLASCMCHLPGCYHRFQCYSLFNTFYTYKEIKSALLNYLVNE